MTPTVEQFLTKLAANKSEAIAFDACRPDLTRRQHCELVLAQVKNSCASVAESKRLADARATNSRLKAEVAAAKNRLKFITPEATVRHNLHAAPGKKLPVGPAKPSASINPVKASTTPIKRELTGIARTAAAFAGTTNRSAISTNSNLTGIARTAAFFARQSK